MLQCPGVGLCRAEEGKEGAEKAKEQRHSILGKMWPHRYTELLSESDRREVGMSNCD